MATFAYDSYMRLERETDGRNNSTTYTYGIFGRLASKTAPGNLYRETYAYDDAFIGEADGQSRIVRTIEGDQNSPAIRTATYTDRHGRNMRDSFWIGNIERFHAYDYDFLGNRTQELSAEDAANGRAFTYKYEYDIFGRLTAMTNNQDNRASYKYDHLGRRIEATDPKGMTSYFDYDAHGRLTEERIPFIGSHYMKKWYGYDNNGNLTRQTITNNIPGMLESTSMVEYRYDSMNRLSRVESYDNNAIASYTEYEYYDNGLLRYMKAANGTKVTAYTYDNHNRLHTMTDPLGQAETYLYDASGNLDTFTDRNGNTTRNRHDALNRLQEVRVTRPDGTAAPEFKSYTYTRTGIVRSEENEHLTITRSYDALGRLDREAEAYKGGQPHIEKTYTYDLANNRRTYVMQRGVETISSYTYDYDSLGRLWKVFDSGMQDAIATYLYDDNGNREWLEYANGNRTR